MTFPHKPFLLLTFFTFSLFNKAVFAEQTMDSEDALSIAQVTASDRCQKGKFGEALESEQNALKIAESRYGPTHSSLVPILANLAALDRHMALYPEAESNLKWALAIEERNFGPRDPRAANPLTQLASLYFDWGHWEDAEFFQKKALSLLEKTNGGAKDRLELAEAWELLGRIDLRLHKPEEALSLLKKSSETLEKDTTLRPERLLASWDFLAQAYQASSRPAGKQSCLEKSLRLAESRFKPNSVEVADARQQLADFYRSKKRETEAKPLYDSALKIYQGCVGSYFGYSSLPYIQKLAQAEETAGLWKEAEDLLQKDLQACGEIYGPKHPSLAVALLNLAKAQKGLGQEEAARANLKKALQMAKAFYRDDYPLVVQIQKELGE